MKPCWGVPFCKGYNHVLALLKPTRLDHCGLCGGISFVKEVLYIFLPTFCTVLGVLLLLCAMYFLTPKTQNVRNGMQVFNYIRIKRCNLETHFHFCNPALLINQTWYRDIKTEQVKRYHLPCHTRQRTDMFTFTQVWLNTTLHFTHKHHNRCVHSFKLTTI